MLASSARAVFAAELTANTTISAPRSASAFTIFPVLIIIPLFVSVAYGDRVVFVTVLYSSYCTSRANFEKAYKSVAYQNNESYDIS